MSQIKESASEAENECTNFSQQMETVYTENASIIEKTMNGMEECRRYGGWVRQFMSVFLNLHRL